MSDYEKQIRSIVEDYRISGEHWPASTADIAQWALAHRKYDLKHVTVERILRRDISQAMRGEYFIDEKGRRVRAKHPARTKKNSKKLIVWDDIRTAPRYHMEVSFAHRRNHILGECHQVKTDVDSFNDNHATEIPIQMVLDFTKDVAELESYEQMTKNNKQQPIEISINKKNDQLVLKD
jgi:hypothetical protein